MTEDAAARLIDQYRNEGDASILGEAVSALAAFLYTNLARYRLSNLDDDTRSDFITWLYPRLASVIRQFNPEKAAFPTYLNWVVRLSFRTFLKNKYSVDARQRVYEIEEATRLLSVEAELENGTIAFFSAADSKPDYGELLAGVNFRDMSDKKREILFRKLLLLACKAGNCIDDASIQRVALVTGYPLDSLREKIDILREKTLDKHDRDIRISERINGYYVRAQRCLYEMKYLDKETARYEHLAKEYAFCLKRIAIVKKNAARRIRTPSNRLLSMTLGISRGTIDSTLAPNPPD